MPELPEVETTLRAIEKFSKSNIQEIKVHNRNLRWKVDRNFEQATKNQLINKLSRRAKYIIFHLENNNIILHLGMSGSLRIANRDDNYFVKHDHIEFIFDKEKIIYNDPRRFGSIHLAKKIDDHKLIMHLGPEPLSKTCKKPSLARAAEAWAQKIKSRFNIFLKSAFEIFLGGGQAENKQKPSWDMQLWIPKRWCDLAKVGFKTPWGPMGASWWLLCLKKKPP